MEIEKYKMAANIMSGIYQCERNINQVEEIRKIALDNAKKKFLIEIKIESEYINDVMPIYDKMRKKFDDMKERLEKEFEEL